MKMNSHIFYTVETCHWLSGWLGGWVVQTVKRFGECIHKNPIIAIVLKWGIKGQNFLVCDFCLLCFIFVF